MKIKRNLNVIEIFLFQGKGQWENLRLAYKTLGVVFGGLVTSPLYVYPSIPLKSPTEGDYLGIFSILFWTLTLIGVVKYACIALQADDQGEGIKYKHTQVVIFTYLR